MSIAFALALLAATDCALCGIRAAAGREGRLEKRAYYVSAAIRAFGLGLLLIGAHVLLVVLLVATAPAPATTWSSFLIAGRVCVVVYGIFATLIFVAFGFYFAPVGDFRVLTNVIVFGPLTLTRPAVIALGLAVGAILAPEPRVAIVAVSAAITMLAFQPLVSRRYHDRWRRLLPPHT